MAIKTNYHLNLGYIKYDKGWPITSVLSMTFVIPIFTNLNGICNGFTVEMNRLQEVSDLFRPISFLGEYIENVVHQLQQF